MVTRLEKSSEVSGAKALRGQLKGWFRMRTGDYRIRFFVKGTKVVVDTIGHRKEIFEG